MIHSFHTLTSNVMKEGISGRGCFHKTKSSEPAVCTGPESPGKPMIHALNSCANNCRSMQAIQRPLKQTNKKSFFSLLSGFPHWNCVHLPKAKREELKDRKDLGISFLKRVSLWKALSLRSEWCRRHFLIHQSCQPLITLMRGRT